ncbi:Hydroperoxy fatty acid reductase gpx1 [BD1-7 clade bacterium]|uniref:Glutathione peroxidase n=1 Tax=BD1-7 clade bacterium TaxID=2029982 RepID=A0A5S9PD00_9GAMM|nr:Hydroperoxy fatty acid reductase gpx1 [BD1-7 clade bacterium]CAA0102376.1 Hydroperoxy fatty acid reductase gpx1 [BD1-7 clade bacterium]
MSNVHDFTCKTINGEDQPLKDFSGKIMVVVNTASKCGLTPQFKGLESLYEKYKDQGVVVLGFPCNQFANQDPGSETDIAEFCQMNYGVSFPMFAKINVNGSGADPLYNHLKEEAPGLLGSKGIKWNFTKFLVDQNGKVIKRYAPSDQPEKMEADINKLLA